MTTGWSDQSFHRRLATMGDTAEEKFESLQEGGSFVRFGFNRPPFRMTHLTSFTRHTPDYVTRDGLLVECMGMGRDGVLKFKPEKYKALMEWNAKQDVAERRGQTPQGRQYYQKAEAEMKRENWAGAIQNLQMAQTFEKENELFKEKIAEVRERQKNA